MLKQGSDLHIPVDLTYGPRGVGHDVSFGHSLRGAPGACPGAASLLHPRMSDTPLLNTANHPNRMFNDATAL